MEVLDSENGVAIIEEQSNGIRHVRVDMKDPSSFVSLRHCTTMYDLRLIKLIFDVKGPAWLCEEIIRDEDPGYVQRSLKAGVLGYVPRAQFDGSRVLDFGCGGGASTVVLGRMLGAREIVGIDLEPDLLRIAQARLEFYDMTNVRLRLSTSPLDLPPDIGTFDFIVLSGVLEHLLPNERRFLLPALWRALNPGGVTFICETPSRWLPIEMHTTGLPLLNYLPKRIALEYARRISKTVDRGDSWEDLLRRGIRGASLQEVLRLIRAETAEHQLVLTPTAERLRGPIGVWLAGHHDKPRRTWQKAALQALRVLAAMPPRLQWRLAPALLPTLRIALRRPSE
jgi:2-polyprenyl-3-methyl-5-hydroxy-6-metoxy-1,4-benzoquinol methylase